MADGATRLVRNGRRRRRDCRLVGNGQRRRVIADTPPAPPDTAPVRADTRPGGSHRARAGLRTSAAGGTPVASGRRVHASIDKAASRLRLFLTIRDARFEDLTREGWAKTVYRDLSAGLIVALTAIPMAMGFAMAMGLRPEQGIVAGAIACLVGRTFGGSKYQVYGPTAAFIPVIAGLMLKYGEAGGGSFAAAHGFLVFVSLVAGAVLMLMGLFGLGKYAKLIPNSIVVGFTVGIAVTIALSNAGEALGLSAPLRGGFVEKLRGVVAHAGEINPYALLIAAFTFAATRGLLRISVFIPAPLIALGLSTLAASTLLAGRGVLAVRDRYGAIPTDFFVFTPPRLPELTASVALDVAYFVVAIVFVSGVESLLCSSMADRLANNRKTPFNPDKEFWGQGLVQIITPLINGFPCTGALARTATSIKAGAVTPLAGYFKGVLKLTLAYFMARHLEAVPMACIGGILLWVASNMIKPAEIREVARQGRLELGIMIYTAVMVPLTDFLTGVLSALAVYAVFRRLVAGRRPSPSLDVSPGDAASG
jgi:SulP family sulfate permease